MTLQQISKIMKLSVPTVSKLLGSLIKKPFEPVSIRLARNVPLSLEQKAYLVSDVTLRSTASNTLDEKAVLFHRKFPARFVNRSTHSRLYKKHKIRKKSVKFIKFLPSK
jgi:hypothetical protein